MALLKEIYINGLPIFMAFFSTAMRTHQYDSPLFYDFDGPSNGLKIVTCFLGAWPCFVISLLVVLCCAVEEANFMGRRKA